MWAKLLILNFLLESNLICISFKTDLYGQNLLTFTHPDDHAFLKRQLIPEDLEKLFDVHPEDDAGELRPRTQEEEELIDKQLANDKRTFTFR